MSSGRAESSPALVGDIGGTNARFGLIENAGAEPARVETLRCADYAGPAEAIEAYLAQVGGPRPRRAAFGIANPVTGDAIRMTNHHWSFSIDAQRRKLGLDELRVINDFSALALAVPRLGWQGLRKIGGGQARTDAPIGLIGPGTGLGVSALIPTDAGYRALPGEGGHATLATHTEEEAAVAALLSKRYGGHVSSERALSGPGLQALYEALGSLRGQLTEELAPADVSRRAQAASDPLCVDACNMFCALLGTAASNLALTLGAFGGIYIGGGVVPKLGELFVRSPFRQRFEEKGRFSAYLAGIPVFVITASNPALLGAAAALEGA